MPHHRLAAALAGLVLCSATAHASSSRYEMRDSDGAIVTSGELGPADGANSILTSTHSPGFQTATLLDPRRPQRVLVRFHDEPVVPHLRRHADGLRAEAIRQGLPLHAVMASARDSQRARLEDTQQTVMADWLNAGHVERVHARFMHLSNAISITATVGSLDAMRRDPRIASVQADHIVRSRLAESVPLVAADHAWTLLDPLDLPVTGTGMTVAILDTGIDYTHADLGGCFGPGCRVRGGYDFVNDDADPIDDNGHGTHVAGIVAANGTLRGVAPGAQLLAYKVLSAGGWGYESWIIAALEAAVDPDGDPLTGDHADVINMSLGGPGAPDSAMSEAANNAVAAGSIVVVAAGNSGSYWSIDSPGNARDVITVAASSKSDLIAPFSSRGPIDGETYLKPELTAPGDAINSTVPGGRYAIFSGTSMAAPHVAGAAALLKQLLPALSPELMKSRLAGSAHSLGADMHTQGAGRLDLQAATSGAGLHALPALVSFGWVEASHPIWQKQVTLVVRNDGAASQALSLAPEAPLPPGAKVVFEPAEFELVAGAEREVLVTLTVDNAQLPYAQSGAFHYEFAVTSGTGFRIPFSFHKAAELQVTVDTPEGYTLLVYSDDGTYLKYAQAVAGQPISRFRLRPGIHHLAAIVWTGDTWALIGREDIDVGQVADVQINPLHATHLVHVGTIMGSDGLPVDHDDIAPTGNLRITLEDAAAGVELFLNTDASTASLFRLSELSDRYKIRALVELRDQRFPLDATVRYRPVTTRPAGVTADVAMSLDTQGAGKIRFGIVDHAMLSQGPARIALVSWEYRRRGNYLVGWGTYAYEDTTSDQPLGATIYNSVRPQEETAWSFLQPVAAVMIDASQMWEQFIASPGLLLFPAAGNYSVVDAFRWGGELVTSVPTLDGSNLIVDGGFHFRTGFVSDGSVIEALGSSSTPFFDRFPVMGDSNRNLIRIASPYRLTCQGETDTGVLDGGSIPVPSRCLYTDMHLQVDFVADVTGGNTPSRAVMSFLNEPFTPWLTHLEFIDDGRPSRTLISARPQLRFAWEFWTGVSHTVQLRLDRRTWRTLPTRLEDGFLVVDLPVSPRLHVASLRLSAEHVFGRTEHTLNSVFLLGQGDTLPVFSDSFEPD
jgi:subtilisin family serine protease